MRTELELQRAIGRIAHSYESILAATDWIMAHPDGQQTPEWNPYVESFLLHARKLAQFLDPMERVLKDDVTVKDFLGEARRFSVSLEEGLRRSISKRLAHITHSIVFVLDDNADDPRWPIVDICQKLTKAMAVFRDDLASVGDGFAERLGEAQETRFPRYRKHITNHERFDPY